MIAKEITGNIISQQYSDGKLNVSIAFDWFETDKKRMRKVAEDGTEFGIMVGKTIKDGDVLAETEDKRYFARIKTAQLIEIPVNSMKEMGRLCFELGNRHLSLKVENDRVLVPYDHPTMEYTKKIGYEPHIIEGGFDGFLIVKAHAGTGTLIPAPTRPRATWPRRSRKPRPTRNSWPRRPPAIWMCIHTTQVRVSPPKASIAIAMTTNTTMNTANTHTNIITTNTWSTSRSMPTIPTCSSPANMR